jgi:NADP-dependent 3-hydroxy acid dehydrogenase YdfG
MKSTNSANWILVTGSSTGIGGAATFTLAENGYRVLAAVRKQEDVESSWPSQVRAELWEPSNRSFWR